MGGKLENKSRWNQDQADHTSRLVESIHTYPFSTSLGARSILVVHEIIMLDLLGTLSLSRNASPTLLQRLALKP